MKEDRILWKYLEEEYSLIIAVQGRWAELFAGINSRLTLRR